MSKAEKFIQNCTRNCSNLVYKDTINGKEFNTYNEWLTPDQARTAVEIEREEMIKKACNFVAERLFFNGNMLYTNIQSKIVEDLKQAIKNE
jgi:hypothetical protein